MITSKTLTSRERILKFMRSSTRWASPAEVAASLKLSVATAKGQMGRMYAAGELDRQELKYDANNCKAYIYRSTSIAYIPQPVVRPEPLPPPASIFEAIIRIGHDEDFEHSPAITPTMHPPGSAGKIEVMRQRVAAGRSPTHPLDETRIEKVH